jgi:hypothetical protein
VDDHRDGHAQKAQQHRGVGQSPAHRPPPAASGPERPRRARAAR